MGQKVLVIGSGAREHAIAHALLRGDSVSEVTVASGNPGMELDGIRTTQINESNHADGLAAGKGVTVAMDVDTAITALDDIFIDHRFGKAGAKVVIEDFLEGQEFSLMSFVRGTEFWPMPISQDHKRAYDNDVGPNTGGMGAYSPVPQIGQDVIDTAIDTIVRPTVEAMAAEGTPFTGILYAGLIATADGPKVIEFNARFGDPETEVVLPKLTSDFGAAISAILDGGTPAFTWDSDNATLGVVLASNGYPVNVIKGAKIPSIPVDDASHVYYAGVSNSDQGLVASSGRVLLIETTAPDLKSAQDKVYERHRCQSAEVSCAAHLLRCGALEVPSYVVAFRALHLHHTSPPLQAVKSRVWHAYEIAPASSGGNCYFVRPYGRSMKSVSFR